MSRPPTLFIFSGLPGSGKSSIARKVAGLLRCTWLRIDTIEQALRDLCSVRVEGEGYELAYRIAADNLRCGTSVVADSCNPIELTRRAWERVALDQAASFMNIEIVCSDAKEHRKRIEERRVDVEGLALPTWQSVEGREYHPWTSARILIDTSGRTLDDSVDELMAQLGRSAAR